MEYIQSSALILTTSKDACVRVWTRQGTAFYLPHNYKGEYVGTFGQESQWDLNDRNTFSPPPSDVSEIIDESDEFSDPNAMALRQLELKAAVIKKFAGTFLHLHLSSFSFPYYSRHSRTPQNHPEAL